MNGRDTDIDVRIRGPTIFLFSFFPKCFQPAAKAPGVAQDSSMLNNRVTYSWLGVSFSLVPVLVYLESNLGIILAASQDSDLVVVGRACGGESSGRKHISWFVFF